MVDPPVTITAHRYGAAAQCHLCPWQATIHHAYAPDGRSSSERVTTAWSAHWRDAHPYSHLVHALIDDDDT